LTQGFFTSLIEKGYGSRANPEKGRFRSFLLGSLKYYLQNERDRQLAQKRGGRASTWALDLARDEEGCTHELSDPLTPERIFEKQWAATLVDNVFQKFEAEVAESGKREQFQQLKPLFLSSGEAPYKELAARLHQNPSSLKVAVYRFRHRYGELLRREIADTVASPGEIEDEIRYLLQVLSS
jgi:RNA polymerase sigma-70 factor (ECF subfamily)